jgi:hypothetical protein
MKIRYIFRKHFLTLKCPLGVLQTPCAELWPSLSSNICIQDIYYPYYTVQYNTGNRGPGQALNSAQHGLFI